MTPATLLETDPTQVAGYKPGLLAADESAARQPKRMREALAKMNTVTFFGPIKFGPTGQVISLDPPVFQVQKGKQVVILPTPIKQGDLLLGVK